MLIYLLEFMLIVERVNKDCSFILMEFEVDPANSVGGGLVLLWYLFMCWSVVMVAFAVAITAVAIPIVTVAIFYFHKHSLSLLSKLPTDTWWRRWLLVPAVMLTEVGSFAMILGIGALALMHYAPPLFGQYALEFCMRAYTERDTT